jgi:hypothetical protein
MNGYRALEKKLTVVILRKFGLGPKIPPEVKVADRKLMALEVNTFWPNHTEFFFPDGDCPTGARLTSGGWTAWRARDEFLAKWSQVVPK